jgi:small subunit ribosomal protein S15
MNKEQRTELVKKFGTKYGNGPTDTGCAATQIALLTERINGLSGHFTKHVKDFHSNRGLLMMIGQRKRLLKYISSTNEAGYKDLLIDLNLRK